MSKHDLLTEYGNDMPIRLPLHKNPGLEIVYIKRGHLTWECEGHPETILPESIYFTLPWQEHGSSKLFESGYEIYFAVLALEPASSPRSGILFRPELELPEEVGQQVSELLCSSTRHTWPATPVVQVLMPELLRELNHPGIFHTARIRTLLKQIILELARTVEQGAARPVHQMNSAWRLRGLLEKLEQDYSRKWTLDAMAAETGLRRTQFSILFKHATGESPLNYLTSLRVSKAAQMLEETARSVTAIAFMCGFSSSQHFANLFKKKIGLPPLQYRKQGLPPIQVPRIRPDSASA